LRGLAAAFRAVDDYGLYLGIGLTMFIGLQAVTNLAVVLGLLPTKGLTLPFLSFGGSSLLVNCVAVGILLNVSRPRRADEASETRASATLGFVSPLARPRARFDKAVSNRRTRSSRAEAQMSAEGGLR
jgi:cell division protein FtsW